MGWGERQGRRLALRITPAQFLTHHLSHLLLQLGRINHYRFNTMPQLLTPRDALPLAVTGKALNRYTNILPNPVRAGG